MQDDYVKAFEKIKMNENRKAEMRELLMEGTATGARVPAKTTRLGAGAKAGIAAAAVTITLGALFIIPTTRNTIYAGVRALFNKEVPEGATDVLEKEAEGRAERVIPTDEVSESEAEEILAAVSSQDQAEDDFFEAVTVTAEYYSDPDLNELANYYAQQGYSLLDLEKNVEYDDFLSLYNTRDWFSSGFTVSYWVGDNAFGYSGSTVVFKATEEQLEGFLLNNLDRINTERTDHNQETVTYDELWTESTDSDGNRVITGSWTGPEPELKLEPSDRARFINYAVTYDAETQIVICSIEEGGGVG